MTVETTFEYPIPVLNNLVFMKDSCHLDASKWNRIVYKDVVITSIRVGILMFVHVILVEFRMGLCVMAVLLR